MFSKLADMLNDAGYDVMKVLRHDVEIPWTEHLVKDLLWKQLQKAMYDKSSTTELSSGEMQVVYDVLNRYMGEKFKIHCPWPSLDALIEEHKNILKHKYPE